MAIRTLEIRKHGEGYTFLEQAGSNYHKDRPVYEAPDRKAAEAWLAQQGGDPKLVEKVLADANSTEQVFFEIAGDYRESEQFPKRAGQGPAGETR